MSIVTRVNGDVQPVFAYDVQNGKQTGTISADALVQFEGGRLDFFKIMANDGSAAVDLRAQLGAGGAVEAIFKTINQLGGVRMYQVEGDSTGQISVGVYPAGAWTATTLQAAIRALGTVNGADLDTTAVTAPGLQLA
jgi:hypothetical protein